MARYRELRAGAAGRSSASPWCTQATCGAVAVPAAGGLLGHSLGIVGLHDDADDGDALLAAQAGDAATVGHHALVAAVPHLHRDRRPLPRRAPLGLDLQRAGGGVDRHDGRRRGQRLRRAVHLHRGAAHGGRGGDRSAGAAAAARRRAAGGGASLARGRRVTRLGSGPGAGGGAPAARAGTADGGAPLGAAHAGDLARDPHPPGDGALRDGRRAHRWLPCTTPRCCAEATRCAVRWAA